jgi:hypothetical protein
MSGTGVMPARTDAKALPPDQMDAWVESWARDGVISSEQATLMLSDIAVAKSVEAQHRSHVASLVVEALGYLGAVIIVVGLGLIIGEFWDDLPVWLTVVGAFVLAAGFVGAGAVMPVDRSDAANRLRTVLYAVAVLPFAGGVAIAATEWFGLEDIQVGVAASAGAAVFAGALWFVERRPLQHVAFYVAALFTVGTTTTLITRPANDVFYTEMPMWVAVTGLAIWAFGLAWLLLSWAGLIKPRELGKVLGAVAMVTGIMNASEMTWAMFLGLATVTALVVLAVLLRDFGLLIVGAIGTLQVLPMLIMNLFPGVLTAALALLVVGVLLVLAAIYIARRRSELAARAERHRDVKCPLPVAIAVTAAVWVGVAVVIGLTAAEVI